MLPTSLSVFGIPTHRVSTTTTIPTTTDPGYCPNNPRLALYWIENLKTFLDNDPAQYSEANKTLITLNRITLEPLVHFTEKWFDRIICQPNSPKIFDTLVRDFKFAITRRLSQTTSPKDFHSMKPQERAQFLRQHPTLDNRSSSPSTETRPFAFPNFPAFRKWNPVERAKYLRHQLSSENKKTPLSIPRPTPHYPPGLSRIPSQTPVSSPTDHSLAPVITGIPTERTLKIIVVLHVYRKDHETTAIIDSGATGSFIDTQLA